VVRLGESVDPLAGGGNWTRWLAWNARTASPVAR